MVESAVFRMTFNGREIYPPGARTEYAARRTGISMIGTHGPAKSLYARWGAVTGGPDAA